MFNCFKKKPAGDRDVRELGRQPTLFQKTLYQLKSIQYLFSAKPDDPHNNYSNIVKRIEANDPTLVEHTIEAKHIQEDDLREGEQLSLSLERNTVLRSLDVSSVKGISKFIVGALGDNKCLTHLNLYDTDLGKNGGVELGKGLETNKTLTFLDLEQNALGPEGGRAVLEGLMKNNTLIQLSLVANALGPSGGQLTGELLKVNRSLQYLSLRSNKIGVEGCEAVAAGLTVNKTLTSIDLSVNYVKAGAQAVGKMLETNRTLTALNLGYNMIDDDSAAQVVESIASNNALASLNLDNNPINSTGAARISRALENNRDLSAFRFNRSDEIEDSVTDNIDHFIQRNSNIQRNWVRMSFVTAAYRGLAGLAPEVLSEEYFTGLKTGQFDHPEPWDTWEDERETWQYEDKGQTDAMREIHGDEIYDQDPDKVKKPQVGELSLNEEKGEPEPQEDKNAEQKEREKEERRKRAHPVDLITHDSFHDLVMLVEQFCGHVRKPHKATIVSSRLFLKSKTFKSLIMGEDVMAALGLSPSVRAQIEAEDNTSLNNGGYEKNGAVGGGFVALQIEAGGEELSSRPVVRSSPSVSSPSPVSAQRFTHLPVDQKAAEPTYETSIRQTSVGMRPSNMGVIPMSNYPRQSSGLPMMGGQGSPSSNNSASAYTPHQPLMGGARAAAVNPFHPSDRPSDFGAGPQIEIHMGASPAGAHSGKGGADSIQAFEYDQDEYN